MNLETTHSKLELMTRWASGWEKSQAIVGGETFDRGLNNTGYCKKVTMRKGA